MQNEPHTEISDLHDWIAHYNPKRHQYRFEHVDDMAALYRGRRFHVSGRVVETAGGLDASKLTVVDLADWRAQTGVQPYQPDALAVISGKSLFRMRVEQIDYSEMENLEGTSAIRFKFYAFGKLEESAIYTAGNLGLRSLRHGSRRVSLNRDHVEMNCGQSFANFMYRLHSDGHTGTIDDTGPRGLPF